MSNIYSALLDTLTRPREASPSVLFAKLTKRAPLTVSLGDTHISQGLFCSPDWVAEEEDIGREVALLPCEAGFLILCFIREVAP